jgi:glycine reductase
MKLETLVHPIDDVRFSEKSSVDSGILSLDRRKIESLVAEEPGIQLITVDIASPGQSVRIAHVLDVVEPRAKENFDDAIFPGFLGPASSCGSGRTHILKGVAVVGVSRISGAQEGLIDMSEAAQAYCPFSRTHNIVLQFQSSESTDRVTADRAIRRSLLKIAAYLGTLARDDEADLTECFEWPLPTNDLPQAGLIYLVQSQGDLRRTYLEGQPLDEKQPMIISPTITMDGAIVSGNFVMPSNKTCTFIHQNHPLIREMFNQHGKTLNFKGVILANEMSRLEEKTVAVKAVVDWVKKLELSGVVINQEGGANTLTDVMMLCRLLEDQHINTVLILNEFAGIDGTTPSLAETTDQARHIVSTGNNDHCIKLPAAERVIGSDSFPGLTGSLKEDITVPLARIHSSTNQLGFNYLSCNQRMSLPSLKLAKGDRPLRVVHYLNQFFGQIGGEDKANAELQLKDGPIGPGLAFKMLFGEKAEIVATIICGDNTMAEDLEKKSAAVAQMAQRYSPDLIIAGPCFIAGRYGMACGAVGKAVNDLLGIPTIVGISEANPGVDVYCADTYMVPCGKSAAKLKNAAESMVNVALSLAAGNSPPEGSCLQPGIRRLVFRDACGAARAVEMLGLKLDQEAPPTELPLPKFDRVDPAPPLMNFANATLVLGTEGGLTPKDNPDGIEMSMATKFGAYSIEGLSRIDSKTYTVAHGGFDNTIAKADPNRLLPLDVMRELQAEGVVGNIADVFYTTAGNATSVENATQFGREIAEDIRRRFKQNVGVVFTST